MCGITYMRSWPYLGCQWRISENISPCFCGRLFKVRSRVHWQASMIGKKKKKKKGKLNFVLLCYLSKHLLSSISAEYSFFLLLCLLIASYWFIVKPLSRWSVQMITLLSPLFKQQFVSQKVLCRRIQGKYLILGWVRYLKKKHNRPLTTQKNCSLEWWVFTLYF